jgi:transmembrane sensor
MSSAVESPSGAGVPSAADCAQAAAWIARLHGEGRTAQLEAGFQRWLGASPEHRTAFEMANDIWTATERCPKSAARSLAMRPRRARLVALRRVPLALAATASLLLVATALYFRDPGLSTAVGEQRTVTLEDGTRVTMNTATHVHVEYDRDVRRIILDRGEALFEVSKRPKWPFMVVAGAQQVRALGTEFLVRRDERQLAITLLEGKVTVSPTSALRDRSYGSTAAQLAAASHRSSASSIPQQHDVSSSGTPLERIQPDTAGTDTLPEKDMPTRALGEIFALSPGERLTFMKDKSPTLDRPPLEKVIAWERGHVIFDHTPLGEAVREMNRYSDIEIRIEDPETERTQVMGVFRTGESENFARAVAEAYRLRLVYQSGTLILIGIPRAHSP